jgi:hypothetical protein
MKSLILAIFQVLTAVSRKIRTCWDIASCSLIRVDRCFRGVYCLCHQGDDWIHHPDDGAVCTSETSVYSNETTQRYIPEGPHLQSDISLIN